MGYTGNYVCKLDWVTILRLYASGDGVKAIAKITGGTAAAIREGLIKRGAYQPGQNRKRNNVGPWAGYYDAEIAPMIAYERQHARWCGKMVRTNSALDWYYANHEANKEKCATRAKARYYRLRGTAEYKAKQFARNQLMRIVRQVRNDQLSRKTNEYLGCTYEQAAAHLTAQLPPQWTWNNYGSEWEIDHRVQLSDGALTDEEHIHRVCHYTNLRPMAVMDNRRRKRGAKHGQQYAA
jgi:hypothetical protein